MISSLLTSTTPQPAVWNCHFIDKYSAIVDKPPDAQNTAAFHAVLSVAALWWKLRFIGQPYMVWGMRKLEWWTLHDDQRKSFGHSSSTWQTQTTCHSKCYANTLHRAAKTAPSVSMKNYVSYFKMHTNPGILSFPLDFMRKLTVHPRPVSWVKK